MLTLTNTIDTTHDDIIHDAQGNLYGTLLATCSSDSTIKIYELSGEAQKYKATLTGHNGPVWQVTWAHPIFGNILASCSYDKRVIIWQNVDENWIAMHEHTYHGSSVNSICWAPYTAGLKLACASSDGSISIISCQPNKITDDDGDNENINPTKDSKWTQQIIENAHELGVNAVCWSPLIFSDKLFKPTLGNSDSEKNDIEIPTLLLVSGGCDNYVKIWRPINDETQEESNNIGWEEDCKLEGHTDWVRDVAWAPSLGIHEQTIASCSQDKSVIIWKNEGRKPGCQPGEWKSHILHTFDNTVWHVSWSAVGHVLAVSSGEDKVSLWQQDLNGYWLCITDYVSEDTPAES